MKIGVFHVFLFLFSVCLISETLLEPYFSLSTQPVRYLKYTLPFAAFFIYFFIDKAKVNYKYFSYLGTFLVFYLFLIIYLLASVLINKEFQSRFIPNASFILLPLLLIFLLSPFFKAEQIREYVKFTFFVNVLIFLLREWGTLFFILSNLGGLKQAFLSSEIKTENQIAYTMGLFLFYFIVEKYPKKYIIACAIVFILSFKRIAIGAFLISLIYYLLSERFMKFRAHKFKYTFIVLGVIANLLFIQLVFIVVNGSLDRAIEGYTHFSTNHFLMGRQKIYGSVINEIGYLSWSGLGLGRVDGILYSVFHENKPLHSDILKNYFEFGVVLFIAWVVLLFHKTSFSNKSFGTLVYFNIMMFTDNVFIYFDFMFYFYFFILIYLSQAFYRKDAGVLTGPE